METIKYFLFILGVCLIIWLIPNLLNNKVGDDEIWWEFHELSDGSEIRIIHSPKCDAKKPFIAWNVQCDILDYEKLKYDVYDFCILEEDADMLNAISYRNIKYVMERQWIFAEDETDYELCKLHEKMWDTTFRKYEVSFSLKEGGLVPQDDNGIIICGYDYDKRIGKNN
jgi:hypothetical protein